MKVIVFGASGYIGSQLVEALEKEKVEVVSVTRTLFDNKIDKNLLGQLLRGVEAVYFLIPPDESSELISHFSSLVQDLILKRIIVLSCLGKPSEIGNMLRNMDEEIPIIELKSTFVIGKGSFVYDWMQSVSKFPVIPLFKWMEIPLQPIYIDDLISFLVRALHCPLDGNTLFEVGGGEKISLKQMLGKKRFLPFFGSFKNLSSYIYSLTTPLYLKNVSDLITLCEEGDHLHDPLSNRFFKIEPLKVDQMIKKIEAEKGYPVRWNDRSEQKAFFDPEVLSEKITYTSKRTLYTSPEKVFEAVRKLGGKRGWYGLPFLWRIRGIIDLLFGGVGQKRGRRDPDYLKTGDVIDGWRVEAYETNRYLKLRAEWKTPGYATLEFYVEGAEEKSTLRLVAHFEPAGWIGKLYWYSIYPFHIITLNFLISGVVKECKKS